MKMNIGPETKRQIILKLRTRLKGALCEHEVKSTDDVHMMLLHRLVEIVRQENERQKYEL